MSRKATPANFESAARDVIDAARALDKAAQQWLAQGMAAGLPFKQLNGELRELILREVTAVPLPGQKQARSKLLRGYARFAPLADVELSGVLP